MSKHYPKPDMEVRIEAGASPDAMVVLRRWDHGYCGVADGRPMITYRTGYMTMGGFRCGADSDHVFTLAGAKALRDALDQLLETGKE